MIIPHFANVYLRQEWNERERVVRLGIGEDAAGFELTPDEAELLTQVLQTLVDQARCVLRGHAWTEVPAK